MARILLSAPDDRPSSWGRHLEVALRELDQEVRFLDFRSCEEPDEELLDAARYFGPVLHVAWKGERYSAEALRELSENGVFVVLWHPDASCPDWLPPLAAAADLCCVQSRGMLEKFEAAGIRGAHWLLEGLTPSCFACGEMGPADRREYGCDVVTVGTVDRHPGYLQRLHALNRLISEGFRVKWWGRKLSFRRNHLRDYLSPAARAFGGRKVWGETYAKACRAAAIFLTIPREPELPGGLSNRALWVTGLGCFYLSLYRQGIEEFFELGREIEVFHNEDEMVAKVRYYMAKEEEREQIARAGQRRTLGNYTNHHAFCRLFRLVRQAGGPDIRVPESVVAGFLHPQET